jgi:cellulose synthase/poly-beta-1,6-N-acetylglucosamine synthase-like glycosyltransferase
VSEVIFWGALATIAYAYVLFPLIVLIRGRLWSRPFTQEDITPRVSIVVAAHNEEDSIGNKLQNMLSMDYPADCLEIIIASDGSDDDTERIVRQFEGRSVRLLSLPRRGKAYAMNAAVAASNGDILVFSDANSMYAPGAVRALVRPFADATVGGVAGDQRYLDDSSAAITADGERAYWDFDRMLKDAQSHAGNVTSATGAIYAIRRSLFSPVPEGVTDDFVTSTQVIAQGRRLVFAPAAIAFEPVARSGGVEFGRKVRVITRGFQSVLEMRTLLNPFKHGFYAIQLFSHKIVRRLVALPLLVLLVGSLILWNDGPVYGVVALGQLLVYGCAALGIALSRTRFGRTRILTLPLFFVAVNVAALMAALKLLIGQRVVMWDPQRPQSRIS